MGWWRSHGESHGEDVVDALTIAHGGCVNSAYMARFQGTGGGTRGGVKDESPVGTGRCGGVHLGELELPAVRIGNDERFV